MPTEVIAIGDEMTSGARVDTNSAWLSRRLGELGHEVARHTTIADEMQPMVDEITAAIGRADVVVITGGLGPTRDDLTREAIAAAAGVDLEFDAASLRHIENLFARRAMPMPPRNATQAMLPAGAAAIDNPGGTAPGIDLTIGRCRLFALPGVPAEMKPMFDRHVAAALLSSVGGETVIRHRVMKFFGIGESDMESRLGDMIARGRTPRVGITVSGATISLRITAVAASEPDCQTQIGAAAAEIIGRVGELHFGDGEGTEQHDVVETMLRRSGRRMITIETGGGSPLADWFSGHGVSRRTIANLSFPGLPQLMVMTDCPNVDAAVAGLIDRWGVDLALIVDGYPTFSDMQSIPADPVPTTLSIHRPGHRPLSKSVTIGGHPSIVRPRIAKTALAWLREVLAEGQINGTNATY